jgi:hypothetical protein
MARRAGVPVVAAVAGVLFAAPAFADVSVSPTSAAQGSGENLTFHVTNTGTRPVGTVTLRLPDDTPVAEVYPLSVDDWAPRIDMRTLSTPLATIHDGTPVSQTAKAITWLAMPGKALAPGRSADLAVAIGPLPELASMQFTIVTTYADGKPGPAMPPASLTLTPAPAGQAPAAHAGHGGTADTAGSSDAEDAAFAQVVAQAQRGPSFWSVAGWIFAGLAVLAGLMLMMRGRHRAEEDDEPEDEDARDDAAQDDAAQAKEPVTGGRWSYRG